MRATVVQLLKVKPLPASAIPSLRLPPSTQKANTITAAAPTRSKPASSADVAAELEKKLVSRTELGDNVRLSSHVGNKDLYWKVSLQGP